MQVGFQTHVPTYLTERYLLRLAIDSDEIRELLSENPNTLPIRHHVELWEAIQDAPLGVDAVRAALEAASKFVALEQLEEILALKIDLEQSAKYIELHREACIREAVRRLGRKLVYEAAARQLEELLRYVPELTEEGDRRAILSIEQLGELYRRALSTENQNPIVLGLRRDFEGWWNGYRMIVVMADTGHGKSTFLAASALATMLLWQRLGIEKKLLFFVLEGGARRLYARWLAGLTGIPRYDLDPGRITEETLEQVKPAMDQLSQFRAYVSEERTLDGILARIQEEQTNEPAIGIGAVYIDYIQMIDAGTTELEGTLRMASNKLVDIGDRYDFPIIVASQVTEDQPFGARAIMHKSNLALLLRKYDVPRGSYTAVVKCVKDSLSGDLFEEELQINYASNIIVRG